VAPINVIGAGLIPVDIVQTVGELWKPDDTAPAYVSGGTVCNILCHLSRRGWPCTIVGHVGNDILAEAVRADLQSFGVDTSPLLTASGVVTRRIAHLITTSGPQTGTHRFDLHCFRCRQNFPSIPSPTIGEVQEHLHGKITRQSILIVDRANELAIALAESVCKEGGLVVFEPGYLPSRLADLGTLEKLMQFVDILKYSEELRYGRRPFRDARPRNSRRLKMVIETRGRRGVTFKRGNRQIRLTTTPIMQTLDSAGAGDAFMAGFLEVVSEHRVEGLSVLCEGLSTNRIEDALKRGQALGGLACLFVGAKGMLYQRNNDEIDAAVSYTSATHRPPEGFGSSIRPRGIQLLPNRNVGVVCPVCYLPIPDRKELYG
jgi:sugar/nucleoside kinase (ribokinase family)